MTETAVRAGAALALSGLKKRFGEVRAVDGIDLVISPGEVVALLGLSTPDSGRISFFGDLLWWADLADALAPFHGNESA